MRIERINENSISCTLTSFDLSVRNLNIRELAYGSDKARKLFSEMMSKASSEVGFDAENTPVMIEAIPMGSNSIKLIISKVSDPEELDTRFSRFTEGPPAKPDTDNWLGRLTAALLEGAAGVSGLSGSDTRAEETEAASGTEIPIAGAAGTGITAARPDQTPDYRVFGFRDLDDVIAVSKVAGAYDIGSTLYKNRKAGEYVLVISDRKADGEQFAKACNYLAEYGRIVRTAPHSLSYFEEHYQQIAAEDILRHLSEIG